MNCKSKTRKIKNCKSKCNWHFNL